MWHELTVNELDLVAGGRIADGKGHVWLPDGTVVVGDSDSFGSGGGGQNGGAVDPDTGWDPDGDDNGNGVPNQYEPIVVTANKIKVGDDHYAYEAKGIYVMFKESDWPWNKGDDGYAGTFVPSNESEAQFVLKSESAVEIGGKAEGGKGPASGSGQIQITHNGGVTSYWKRVD